MSMSIARRLATGGILAAVLLGFPSAVAAEVTGGCMATGQASTSGSIDITTEHVWHLDSTESAGGSGTAPSPMLRATVSAFALGIQVPIASGTSKGSGDTAGTLDPVDLDLFGKLGKIFLVAGSASGDSGSCSGQILIILDDVDALFTLLGGGAIILAIVALAGMLVCSRASGCVSKGLGLLLGLVGGASVGVALAQFQQISPDSPIGWAIAIVGAILGFFLAGRFAKPDVKLPPARPAGGFTPPASRPATPPPTVTDETQGFVNDVVAPGVDAPINPPPDRPTGASRPATEGASGEEAQAFIDGVVAPGVDAPVNDPDKPKSDHTLPPGGVGGGGPM